MNKDTVVASVIGFGLGLVAAIALWVVPRILPKTAPAASDTQVLSEQTPVQPSTTNSLEIISPKDGDILKTNTVTLKGKARVADLVIITTPKETAVASLDTNGNFSADISLDEGANQIVVGATSSKGQQTQQLDIYYFTEGI